MTLPRLLIVDDVPDNLYLMKSLFEGRYEVVQARSGNEALRAATGRHAADLVLLDIMMPDMDGYEVLRRIRQHTPTADIPVIFLTALDGALDERMGMELGAIDYLSKPIDPHLLLERVDAHLLATAHARRIDALSEKLARHLTPESWNRLFHEGDAASIRFEQQQLSILYAEAPGNDLDDPRARESFNVDLDRLATRHDGCIDPFGEAAGVVFFADPASCVRMAMDLQRGSRNLHLRIGVHTGACDIGTFRSSGDWNCTLVGDESRHAAKVAATAATGSIAISPATYARVKHVIDADSSGCLLMEEFQDSDLEQVSITPAPARGGEHGLSTFAGLGR